MATRVIRVFGNAKPETTYLRLINPRGGGHGADLVVVDESGEVVSGGSIATITPEGILEVHGLLRSDLGLSMSDNHSGIAVHLPKYGGGIPRCDRSHIQQQELVL